MKQAEISLPGGEKKHFEVLDGLRGVAAISVVLFHMFELVFPDYQTSPLGHGYLAVDFFFCLSGFVIGYAYDDRMGTASIKSFFKNRFIRLHPLVVLGSVLGLAGYLLDPFARNILLAGLGKILLAFFCSVSLIPSPILPGTYGSLFPLNSPSWSLFMEYLANIGYAFLLSRVAKRRMIPILIAAAIVLCFVSYSNGGLIGGWDYKTWYVGLARVTYSFTAGLCIFRCRWILKNKLHFLLIALLLIGVFISPHADDDWIREAGIVLLVSPFLVSLGAGATVTGWIRRVSIFIGRLSYPLYMTHYFVIWSFGGFMNAYKPVGLHLVFIIIALLSSLLTIAWLAMRFYDEPVRAYLVKKWVKGQRAGQGFRLKE